jgi:hypothetical protein
MSFLQVELHRNNQSSLECLNSTMIVDLKFHSYLRILLLIHNTVPFTNYKKMHILQQKQHQVLLFTCYLFLCNIGGWVCQKNNFDKCV